MKSKRRASDIKITRTQAANIIEEIRIAMVDESTDLRERLARIFDGSVVTHDPILPLRACTGEAHLPGGGNIDNCGVCAPRWGVMGPRVVVT